jgi:acetyl esterase/lipase
VTTSLLTQPWQKGRVIGMNPIKRLGWAWVLASCVLFTPVALATEYTRVQDVVYGRKHGMALTLDVFQPADPNGFGVVHMVSGGWYSSHDAIQPAVFETLLARGYTVFAVVHGSQPKFHITEIIPDVHRAVRYIRHHAARWNLRTDQLGVMGASAGGHLSLTLGTQGGPGRPDASDPVDRESSAVAAVACFFPPTDFLNYGKPGEDAVGVGILHAFQSGFGPRSQTPEGRRELGREISPCYFIHGQQAPTLIIHGDADELVPIQQAERFVELSRKAGAHAELIVRPGAAHGWPELIQDIDRFADWFDIHLRGRKE